MLCSLALALCMSGSAARSPRGDSYAGYSDWSDDAESNPIPINEYFVDMRSSKDFTEDGPLKCGIRPSKPKNPLATSTWAQVDIVSKVAEYAGEPNGCVGAGIRRRLVVLCSR